MSDIALILVYTTASCLTAGLICLLLLRLVRHRSLRLTVIITSWIPVLAVALSVFVNVHEMVLSTHDSLVVLIALGWAMVIAVATSVLVGRRVADGAAAVRSRMQGLDADDEPPAPVPTSAPAEMTSLVVELDTVRRRLVASRERERALETSRRELVTFMSHDLRTPLTGLRALAEALDDGVIDDVPAAMQRIRSYVDRMTSLADDLFELSRVTSRTPARPRTLVGLAEVAMDVVAEAADHARTRGVHVRLELADLDDRLPVLGDGDELARAMANLVVNAVRHTAIDGTVTVVGDRGGDGQIRIGVVDECGGIPTHDLPYVFDAGWRGADGRLRDDGGAGFGLAIARGVAQSHAGRIEVCNVAGGCRFELALPVAPQ